MLCLYHGLYLLESEKDKFDVKMTEVLGLNDPRPTVRLVNPLKNSTEISSIFFALQMSSTPMIKIFTYCTKTFYSPIGSVVSEA